MSQNYSSSNFNYITDNNISTSDSLTIDISGYNHNSNTLTITNSADMIDTITFPSNYSFAGGAGATYTTSYDWNSFSSGSAVNIDTNGINIKEGGDIKIGGKSLSDAIEKIEERLGILNPNPELEERWDQLKELRKQYIELEKDILEKEKIMKILKEQ